MPASWLSKYGYGSTASSGQPQTSTQPSWTQKYGQIAPAQQPISPAFQNAMQNKIQLSQTPTPQPTYNPKSIVKAPQPQKSLPQQATDIFGQIGKAVKETVKQTIDFLPKLPDYIKQAAKDPGTAAAGGGEAVLTTFGSLAGLVQQGISVVTNKPVPERWDISKQVQAIPRLSKSLLKNTNEEKAFTTGQFIGQILPYALGAEVVSVGIGKTLLTPTAEKFLPGAVKFIPIINNAISFLGIGQITHNPENGNRVDQLKNDLIMLTMFETGGLVAKGLSKGTKTLLRSTLNDVKGKPKIDFETTQPKVTDVKDGIKFDTGKPAELIATEQMASGRVPKTLDDIIEIDGTQSKVPQIQTGQEVPQAKTIQGEVSQGPQTGQGQGVLKPIGEGPSKVSRLALRVEQTAIEKKLTSELQDLPTYQQMNMKEQAKLASELLQSDPEKAMRIALRQENAPQGLQAESVFKALENSITTPEQALKLAHSPLVTEGSALGQRIKALDVQTSESAVESIKQVLNARAKNIEEKLGRSTDKATQTVVKDIQSKVKAPSKYDWSKFLDSITCN